MVASSVVSQIMTAVGRSATYADSLLADLTEAQWIQRVPGHAGHAASIVGHILIVDEFGKMTMGAAPSLPPEWIGLFMPGTAVKDGATYPAGSELARLLAGHRRFLADAFAAATPEQLAAPTPNEEVRKFLPTVGDALVSLLTIHEAIHLGQLSAWRQAIGLPLAI